MCELGTLEIPAKSRIFLDILLQPLREVSKDFLPAVTKNDEGPFTDRIALIAPAFLCNGWKSIYCISRAIEYWKY